MDAVRLSKNPELPLSMVVKCRAQAASMMRQAKSAIRELKSLQAERRQIESDPETCDRGERPEHITTVLLNEGLTGPETVMASTAWREEAATTNPPLLSPVSLHDPKTRKHKTEIPPRQPNPMPPAEPTRPFSAPSPPGAAVRLTPCSRDPKTQN